MARKRSTEDLALLKHIGTEVRNYRKAANITQLQVAEHLGIAQSNYAKFESGRMGLTVESISKIAELFRMDLNVVFTGKEYKVKKADYIDISLIPEGKRAKARRIFGEIITLLK